MPHHTPLIATIVASLVTAFLLGALAQRFRISPVIGYLLAGVIVGPFTPGYVADRALANELAEIGVILLMFGVGLHFSLKDLMSVGKIAIPGALVQMAAATSLGVALAYAMGWPRWASSCSASRWPPWPSWRSSGATRRPRSPSPPACPDRRVLLHPGQPGPSAEPPAGAGQRPDPGRRYHLDHAQPLDVHPGALGGAANGGPARAAARQ